MKAQHKEARKYLDPKDQDYKNQIRKFKTRTFLLPQN